MIKSKRELNPGKCKKVLSLSDVGDNEAVNNTAGRKGRGIICVGGL